jgi:hypothetical protein
VKRSPIRRRTPLTGGGNLARRTPLKPRSAKTAALYRTERVPLVAALFAESSICEVPWCPELATDPHEPLTRARGGSITDPANVRKVCHPHNVMFGSDEQPWMYELGFLVHSWEAVA